jgi:protein-S-isoprenylcysteine O-methyltransferase Ste14
MKRWLIFIYGALSYAIFFGTFLYAIGFVGNLWVPKSIDSARVAPLGVALLINAGLLGVFAIQHSVMARPAFKRWWTRIIPKEAERSTYTLLSSLALIALFAFWEPIGGVVWSVQSPVGQALIYAAYAFGWTLVLVSTFLINHFDLFGLRQVWLHLIGRQYTRVGFATPAPYRFVRHPLYLGFLVAFWAAPTMTVTHLVFALVTTAYIVVAIQFEERDLVHEHGASYQAYRLRVPMLFPRMLRRVEATSAVPQSQS